MKQILIVGMTVVMGWLGQASVARAQVYIRAPFVRVGVGDGVSVRAPFVNLYVPPSRPVYYYDPYAPPVVIAPPVTVQMPAPQPVAPPMPPAKDDNAPPPIQAAQATTIEAFAKNFQAKAGSYEITMLNPVTMKPTSVRFSLPEGSPRRIIVGRDHLEFVYGLRHFVRIEFDRDGATVISR